MEASLTCPLTASPTPSNSREEAMSRSASGRQLSGTIPCKLSPAICTTCTLSRYHRFDPKKDNGAEFCYSSLALFYPFKNEEEDLSLENSGFASYKDFLVAKKPQIKALLREFEAFDGPIAQAYAAMDKERSEAMENRHAVDAEGPDQEGQDDGPVQGYSPPMSWPLSCQRRLSPHRRWDGG